MATTMKLIAKQTLTGTATSVTFSDIPGSPYTDLLVVLSARTSRNDLPDNVKMTFNGVTTNTYSDRSLYTDGISAQSFSASSVAFLTIGQAATGAGATSNTFGNAEAYIPNYAGSTAKSVSGTGTYESNSTSAFMACSAGVWSGTAAITSIALTPYFGANFVSGSSFYLYGITRSDDNTPGTFGIQATGGEVTISGGYKYHVFKSSGTFTVSEPGFAEVLVVGGGGGAGGSYYSGGGGGGAGGLLTANRLLKTDTYSVVVGAGGTGGTGSVNGVSGTQSSFTTLSSIGGGGGGGTDGGAGLSGGSGGGGQGGGIATSSGGLGTSGQGNNGGGGVGSTLHPGPIAGGGGGGAGAAGANAVVYAANEANGGNGGNGILWAGNYYGGGGGGGKRLASNGVPGTGGLGGGGNGVGGGTPNSGNGYAGTINTGGGGGGAGISDGTNKTGGTGGSGIVIIRYPVS